MEVLFLGVLIGVLAFGNYAFSMFRSGEIFPSDIAMPFPTAYLRATTIAYLTIAFCQFANVLSRRYDFTSVFNNNIFSNKTLLWSILLSISFILTAVYVPFVSRFLYFSGPGIIDWLFVLGAALLFLGVFELMKFRRRIQGGEGR
jgi:Ca2+-transporting ATPase